jgi:hypothetical protein
MAKSIRANLQLVPESDIRDIERMDAQVLTSNPDKFVKENLLGYYILVNTWLMIIKQWSQFGWVFVLNHIKHSGLREVISKFSEAADQIVHGEEITYGVARTLYKDVKAQTPIIGVPLDPEREVTTDPMAAMLFICRYPKRFSPVHADMLKTESIAEFFKTQRRLKSLQRRPFSQYILEAVRAECSQILDWDKLCCELLDVSIKDIVFTPGVSFDTDASLVSKLQSIAKEKVEYFHLPFGIPMVASQGVEEQQYWGKDGRYERHDVRLIAVPKNYKTARVIAPENVLRQATARCYFNISDRYLPASVSLHDQTQNQKLSYLGSLDGKLATIDLHAASDSLTPTLLWEIFPKKFMQIVTRILPTHTVENDKVNRLESAATMGNSMTFWLESTAFLGISLAAVKFHNRFTGETDETVSVYGDDIIVPTNAAPEVIEFLEGLGFIVNHEKSFIDKDHPYRESCGEEYFKGINVSSRYYPRFPIEGTLGGKFSTKTYRDGFTGTKVSTMTSLIDLQHKLFNLCVPAALLVSEIVKEAEPRMTTSTPDQGLGDLWSYEDLPKIVPAPAAEIIVERDERGKPIRRKASKVEVPGQVREGHYGPITYYPPLDKGDTRGELLLDLYNYEHFLRFGPRYDDPLMELLGISSPPQSLVEARSSGEVRYVLLK